MNEKLPSPKNTALSIAALVLAGALPIAATLYAADNRLDEPAPVQTTPSPQP